MNIRTFPKAPVALFWTALVLLSGPLQAQESAVPGATVDAVPATPALDLAGVEKMLADLEASGLEAPIKDALKEKYAAAIEALKSAGEMQAKSAAFREAIQSAPGETDELSRQLKQLPAAGEAVKVPPAAGLDELSKEVEARRAALSDLEGRFAGAGEELNRVKGRPLEFGARLPAARGELAGIVGKLAAPDSGDAASPGQLADRTLLEAQKQALDAEIAMLTQEQLSQSVRESLLLARRDLLARQREIAQATLAALEEQLKQARMSKADRLAAEVGRLAAGVAGEKGETALLVGELQTLAAELKDSAGKLEQAADKERELSDEIAELSGEYKRLQQELSLGGLEGSFGQIMLQQRRSLPNPRPFSYLIEQRGKELRELRLSGFRVDEKIAALPAAGAQADQKTDPKVARLREVRSEVLEELRKNYRALVLDLARIDADERAYRDLIVEVGDYLNDRIFWQRSSAPVGAEFVKSIPAGLGWLFGAARVGEGWQAVAAIPWRHPVVTLLVVLLVGVLLVFRPRAKKSLQECGKRIRRISADRYIYTLRALFDSLVLAAPVPLVLGFIAWALLRDPGGSEWVRGLGHGLVWNFVLLAWVLPLMDFCRPGGLGIAHFGWSERSAAMLRSAARRLMVVYVPASLIIGTTMYEESSRHFDSVGRLSFIVAYLWITLLFIKVLLPSSGILAEMIKARPGSIVAKTRYLWFALAVLAPPALILLACVGYCYTAILLGLQVNGTLWLIAAGVVFYGLVMRWFMIKERKLALTEAIERRRALRASHDKPEVSADEVISADEEGLELELGAVGEQTRRLLRSVIGVGTVVLIWWFWESWLPVNGEQGESPSVGGLTFVDLVQVVLVISIAITLVRNLPGLLDLAGLRNSSMEPGTRYAVATICQYVAIAVAIALLLQILQIDWSKFGWIAAALSVGLGFGLQEIVANFVCGIILLFERPIRVGDVVTIGTVTGTVTKIRMRATTITNWDRQELVVPNKEFVTGSLINWTLSNKINRVVIMVGAAYGSDTVKAREILLSVAADHPLVLEDPAPVASFEAFGDSALNLGLRCYLPDMDNRLGATTDLHAEIDRRFKEAGIEIAFPQRDLHIRDWSGVAQEPPPGGGEGGVAQS